MNEVKSELELLCKELWKHRDYFFGNDADKANCLYHILARAEIEPTVAQNKHYEMFQAYRLFRIDGLTHAKASAYASLTK